MNNLAKWSTISKHNFKVHLNEEFEGFIWGRVYTAEGIWMQTKWYALDGHQMNRLNYQYDLMPALDTTQIEVFPVHQPALHQVVFHRDVYNGLEPFTVVGVRETTVELEGDFSGIGRRGVSWMPIDGLVQYKKRCKEQDQPGGCQLPNVHCQYPDCSPYITNINEYLCK